MVKKTDKGLDSIINEDIAIRMKDLNLSDIPYKMIDELTYNARVSQYLSITSPSVFGSLFNPFPARDMKEEYQNLKQINKMLPENTSKPVGMVLDEGVEKGYIRGYLINEKNAEPVREVLHLGYGKKTRDSLLSKLKLIEDVISQLDAVKDTLKKNGQYDKLPTGTFDVDNMYITDNGKILLFYSNQNMTFCDGNGKVLDRNLTKTTNYLEKLHSKYERKSYRT